MIIKLPMSTLFRIMVLKISSKFELRRFCRTTGAVAMVRMFEVI